MNGLPRRIPALLGPDYAERLLDLREGQPAWSLKSPESKSAIEACARMSRNILSQPQFGSTAARENTITQA